MTFRWKINIDPPSVKRTYANETRLFLPLCHNEWSLLIMSVGQHQIYATNAPRLYATRPISVATAWLVSRSESQPSHIPSRAEPADGPLAYHSLTLVRLGSSAAQAGLSRPYDARNSFWLLHSLYTCGLA